MLFISAFSLSFLFASAVLAYRGREYHSPHSPQSPSPVEQRTTVVSNVYSSNWAGAFWNGTDGTFSSISGTFTVPDLKENQNGSAVIIWIGIDGVLCPGGLLQAGIELKFSDDETLSYLAWYDYWPNNADYFSDLQISAGDVIRLNVTALTPTSGIAVVENLSTGDRGYEQLNSTYALCGQSAEWIVGDLAHDDNQSYPFADFGTVTFTDAVAFGPSGTYTPEGATIVDVQQGNQTLTLVSVNSSSVAVEYL